MGRVDEALAEAIRLVPAGVQTWGLAPSLFELSQRQGSFDRMLEHCRERNDLLGFAAALAHSDRER